MTPIARGIGLAGVLLFLASVPARAALRCDSLAACDDPTLLAEVRGAVRDACPCDRAATGKAYGRCWKPVVKRIVKSRGKRGAPKACRTAATQSLVDSTCGRTGFVLCRKNTRKGAACRVTKAAKCTDPVQTGAFGSCADTCDQIEAIPFPSTVELSGGDLTSLEPDAGDGVLRFAAAPPALDAATVGTILVAGVSPATPAGLLRAVLAVERDGGALTLTTRQAPIQLAYRKLHTRFVRSLAVTPPATSTAAATPARATVAATLPFDFLLFDGDGIPGTTNDQIAVEGVIGGAFDFDFALDFDWGAIDALPRLVTDCLESFADVLTGGTLDCSIDDLLPEARVTFVTYPAVNADVNVRGAAILSYEKEVELASQTLAPIVVGPLVFVPTADLTALLEGGASGMFSTGVHGSALFETSVTLSSKQTEAPQFRSPVLKDTDFGPNDVAVTLHAEAKVGVGGRLNLLLYNVTGPYATARAYGAIEADVFDAPCWRLHAGIEADLGVKVETPIPGLSDAPLVDWRAPTVNPLDLELATGGCDEPPDQSTLPPGSGPDATRLANPTYTPWSRTWHSPVEGAYAGPGNSVFFSELHRTIDGHYVRSGFGTLTLTKFDEAGTLLWARDLDMDGAPLYPVRVRSSTDAAMLVVSRTITAPIVVTTVAQDGTVVGARGYDIPLEVCNVDPKALASDGDGGAWVVGYCVGLDQGFLLHAGRRTTTFRLLGGTGDYLRLKVAETIGRDVFLSGTATVGDALVALRITPEGTIVYSKRYDGCPSATDAIASTAIVGPQGEVTIAGSGGAQHNGTFVRILPNGDLGFATFPGFGFGAGSVFLLDTLAELPTTGYVAGASQVQLTGTEPDNVPSAALVGFDATGHILWANRYTFGAPGAYFRTGQVAVQLSDDGGVVATTLLYDPADPLGGRLWAFKPFAKDGTMTFLPNAVTVTPLPIDDLECSMTASDFPMTVTTVAIGTRTVPAASTPVTLDVAQQTAN